MPHLQDFSNYSYPESNNLIPQIYTYLFKIYYLQQKLNRMI